jgi:predicted RNA-binding protein with PIN domain
VEKRKMGLSDLFRSMFAKKSNGHATTFALVDGDSAASPGRDRGRTSAGQQIAALQWMGDLAQREGLALTAVFGGIPLREVQNGGQYRGITVHFAADEEKSEELLNALAKEKRGSHSVVVITSDKGVRDRFAHIGVETMSISTLRKAVDAGGGRSGRNGGRPQRGGHRERGPGQERGPDRGQDRGEGRGGMDRGEGRGQDRRSRGPQRERQQDQQQQARGDSKPREGATTHSSRVLDLIDPL